MANSAYPTVIHWFNKSFAAVCLRRWASCDGTGHGPRHRLLSCEEMCVQSLLLMMMQQGGTIGSPAIRRHSDDVEKRGGKRRGLHEDAGSGWSRRHAAIRDKQRDGVLQIDNKMHRSRGQRGKE